MEWPELDFVPNLAFFAGGVLLPPEKAYLTE
jgi:hypothetical protein